MLGNRMKSLRKEHNMTQDDLGKKLGVGRTTICEYERETIMPPYEKLQVMAKLFGVSVKYLTGETNARVKDVVDNIEDVAEQLNRTVELLDQFDYVIKFNGKDMTNETRRLASDQLSNIIRYFTLLNKDEQ